LGMESVTRLPLTAELLILSTDILAVSVRPQMVIFLGAEPTILSLFPCADRIPAKQKAAKKTSMRNAYLCIVVTNICGFGETAKSLS